MAEQNPPSHLQNRTDHKAEQDRNLLQSVVGMRAGIVGSGDLLVTQQGTPNMGVTVAAGKAFILGTDSAATQGAYHVWNDNPANLTIAASDPTNPRRDLIVARVQDAFYTGATNAWKLDVVQGTPAASPVDPTPSFKNYIVLARVAVAAAASTITNANITDLRIASQGGRAAALGGTVPCTSTSRPTSPFAGLRIWESDTGREWIYDGSNWIYQCGGRVSVQANKSVAQSCNSGTNTALTFTAADTWDSDAMHDTTSNTDRLTVPTGLGGLWRVTANVLWPTTAGSFRNIVFTVNGATPAGSTAGVLQGGPINMLAVAEFALAAGDIVRVLVGHDNGSAINITTVSATLTRISA